MDDLVTTPYEASAAPIVADLMNAVKVGAGGHPYLTPTGVAEFLSGVSDPERDSRMVSTSAGEPVAFAVVSTPPPGGAVAYLWGGVHPEWQGRGVGRGLLDWQLTRAGEILAGQPGGTAHAGTTLGDTPAERLYQRFGLTPVRHWFEMVAPTADATPVAPPPGVRLVPYTPDTEAALHAAHMEAFADHWQFQQRDLATWAPLMVRSQRFAAAVSLLALDDDEITGYLPGYHHAEAHKLYIGQVGVRTPWRGRGIASALLATALARGAEAGKTVAALVVDAGSATGAVGVYERAGFTVESRSVTYEAGQPVPADGPVPAR